MLLGLFKKDLYSLRYYSLFYLVVYFVVSLLLILMSLGIEREENDPFIFTFLIFFFSGSITQGLVLTNLSIDERANFDKFMLSNGVTRNKLFTSKIIFVLFLCGLIAILNFIVFLIFNKFDILSSLGFLLFNFAYTTFHDFIIFLLTIWLGGIKSSFVLTILSFFIVGIGYGVFTLITVFSANTLTYYLLLYLIPILFILVSICIVFLTKRLFLRKEY